MKVGVFDSGIGGLSVVKSLLRAEIFEEIIYFGDTARVPYGSKDKNTIIRYAIEAVEFFKNFELDMIIVACNTVSAYALEEMQEAASCPVIGVVASGVLAASNALSMRKDANILVIATKATVASQAYEAGLRSLGFCNLQAKATGLFVSLVEEEIYKGAVLQATFEYYFNSLKKPDVVILGCTHFPLIMDALQEYFGRETIFIHSGDAIVASLKEQFDFKHSYKTPKLQFFASQSPDELKRIARLWL
jgi:glutamate racemase